MTSWLDPADVAAWAQHDNAADPALVQATDAAAQYVRGVRPEFVVSSHPAFTALVEPGPGAAYVTVGTTYAGEVLDDPYVIVWGDGSADGSMAGDPFDNQHTYTEDADWSPTTLTIQTEDDVVVAQVSLDLEPAGTYFEPVPAVGAGSYAPNDDVKLGAVMLAGRLFARRGTPLGVAGFSEFGGNAMLRHDPDIARLLGIGPHRAFVFGAPALPVEEEVEA